MKPYYDEDGITIYHADCREVLPELAFDLVVTSPPYNLQGASGSYFSALRDIGYGGHDDSMGHKEYVAWQQQILRDCWNGLPTNGAIFYNHKPLPSLDRGLRLPFELVPSEIPIRQIITWDRGTGHIRVASMFVPSYEWILLLGKPEFRLAGTNNPFDVWRVPFDTKNPHPAPFPLGIPKRCIEPTSARVILDPFAGSGTTLRAAKDLGRKAIGIELEERFCEMAVKRLAQQVLPL